MVCVRGPASGSTISIGDFRDIDKTLQYYSTSKTSKLFNQLGKKHTSFTYKNNLHLQFLIVMYLLDLFELHHHCPLTLSQNLGHCPPYRTMYSTAPSYFSLLLPTLYMGFVSSSEKDFHVITNHFHTHFPVKSNYNFSIKLENLPA